ncbi:MAG TPA: DUF4124 domain-containing protein [Usitatibacter sp.]|jgi:hypothetical protein|nr:DUF4124 domain-containing protein [Usitatibacter sp.]
MSCTQPRRTLARIVAIALAAAGLSAAVHAAEFYRWNDADGRVVYGDKPPQGARNVTRVDVDTTDTTIPARRAPVPQPAAIPAPVAQPAAPQVDYLTQRRATRARLEASLAQAQARLDLARKNLAEATDMAPDEQQTIIEKVVDPSETPQGPQPQQLPQTGNSNIPLPPTVQQNPIDESHVQVARGGMFGMTANRQNCTAVAGKGPKPVVICPTIIPNAAYQERIAALEDAVKKAEEDVHAAEQAYRRGVD